MRSTRTQKSPRLVVLGEFFVDLVFYELPGIPRMGEEVKTKSFAKFPGGGLATTALVATALGTPTGIVTRVGRDAAGSAPWQQILRSGISLECCEVDRHLPTATTVCAAFNGDRMMITHDAINQRLDALLSKATVKGIISRTKHLHLACALVPSAEWLSKIRGLRKYRLTVSADIGWNPEVMESRDLRLLLKEMEFCFPNEGEACAMTGEKSVEAAARKLAQWIRVPVVKLGRDGAIAVCDGKIVRMRSLRVSTVDATGSGDAFNGGFLHGYLAGWPLEDCLRAGNVCGALATTRPGGSSAIPTLGKLRRLMASLR